MYQLKIISAKLLKCNLAHLKYYTFCLKLTKIFKHYCHYKIMHSNIFLLILPAKVVENQKCTINSQFNTSIYTKIHKKVYKWKDTYVGKYTKEQIN